jgi:tRNA A37 threonylcarbamoyladenosine synthetase subunit TsaC/SUA5/YrdC
VDLVLDGGTRRGVPSTVVDVTVSPPTVLRDGAIPEKDIKTVLGVAYDADFV